MGFGRTPEIKKKEEEKIEIPKSGYTSDSDQEEEKKEEKKEIRIIRPNPNPDVGPLRPPI
jgi:hypothetical protein